MLITKRICLLYLVLFCTNNVFSQSDFRDAFIISLSNDTIKGKIDYRIDNTMNYNCKFRDSKTEEEKNYAPHEILSYKFKDGKYFISKNIDSTSYFLEFLAEGVINLYCLNKEGKTIYYIENEKTGITELKYSKKMIEENGRKYIKSSRTHIEILKIAMEDTPQLFSRIEKIKIPTHKSLIKIIEKYHINLDRGNELLIHDKLRRNSNIGLELSAGIINFKRFLNLNDKNYFNSGMILHFNLPRINERLYLRTGIFVANLNFEEEDVTLYRIPIHLEYIHSKGFIKPRLSYGLNINLPYIDNAVSVNAGVSIGINKRLDIILASETDFRAFALFFPKNYLAQSVQLGLNFNFDN